MSDDMVELAHLTYRCGRLEDHDPHVWSRPPECGWSPDVFTFNCPGHIITEGGHWTRCPGCHTSGRPHPVGGVECRETAREKAISQEAE